MQTKVTTAARRIARAMNKCKCTGGKRLFSTSDGTGGAWYSDNVTFPDRPEWVEAGCSPIRWTYAEAQDLLDRHQAFCDMLAFLPGRAGGLSGGKE